MTEEIINENIRKIIKAGNHGCSGYNRDSPLENNSSFCPYPYKSITEIVGEITDRKGKAKILEIGCGEGITAKKIIDTFGRKVDYNAIDLVEPKYKDNLTWINEDIDNFKPQSKYDLIFSVNGIIYGYDDKDNYFKFANALEKEGKFFFNFDGCTNPIKIEKKTGFNSFMQSRFLSSLYDLGMHSFCQNFSGRHVYYGEKNNDNEINSDKVEEKKEEFPKDQWGYVKKFKEPQKWVDVNNREKEIEKDVLDVISAFEKKNGKLSDLIDMEIFNSGLVKWLSTDDTFLYDYISMKTPIEFMVNGILKQRIEMYPKNGR